MKKLFRSAVILSVILAACGPTAEEKAAAQAENEALVNEKIDEIMQNMEPDTMVEPDSTVLDSSSIME